MAAEGFRWQWNGWLPWLVRSRARQQRQPPLNSSLKASRTSPARLPRKPSKVLPSPEIQAIAGGLTARVTGQLPLPRNHDLVTGLRHAHLLAVEKVLQLNEQAENDRPQQERKDNPDNPAFRSNLLDWLRARNRTVDYQVVTAADVQRALDHMVNLSAVEGFAEVAAHTRTEADRLALQNLEQSCGEVPSRFVWFFKGTGDQPGWFDIFALHVNEKIKTEERFRSVFLAAELVDIKRLIEAADSRIGSITAGLARMESGLGRMESGLGRVEGQLGAVRASTGVISEHMERIEKAQHAHQTALDELLAIARAGGAFQHAADQGIPEPALRAIVKRLGGEGIGRDDLVPWLDNWIEAAQRALSRLTNEDEAFEAARREAEQRFRAGRLGEASSAFMDEFAREEREEQERQDERKRRRVRLLEEAIRFDELALDGEAAAQKLGLMAEVEGISGPDDLGQWLHNKASEFFERGDQKGQNGALVIAIATYRRAVEHRARERVPLDWATTQDNLGNALGALGQRESGTARLEEAVAAYQERAKSADPRASAAGLGDNPEQSGNCTCNARPAGERNGAAGGSRGSLPKGAESANPQANAAGLGDNPKQSR